MKEPALMRCAVREGDDEWHIECRFSDGQKYAAIKLDGACPQLATRVAALLNSNIWTDERPSEPGEYWLSMPPGDLYHAEPRCRSAYVYESRRCMVTLDFDSPDAYEPVLVVGGCDETSSVWPDSSDKSIDINSTVFDGAKWSRRETPADPFEVTK